MRAAVEIEHDRSDVGHLDVAGGRGVLGNRRRCVGQRDSSRRLVHVGDVEGVGRGGGVRTAADRQIVDRDCNRIAGPAKA